MLLKNIQKLHTNHPRLTNGEKVDLNSPLYRDTKKVKIF